MRFDILAAYPIVFAICLLLLELSLRHAGNCLQQSPFLEFKRYLYLNGILGLSSVVLASLTFWTGHKYLLLASLEIVWMQVAIFKIYHLRPILFTSVSRPTCYYGGLGVLISALVQMIGATMYIWDRTVRPGYSLKHYIVALLHCGWGLYYLIVLLWVYWISSLGKVGKKSWTLMKNSKFFWLFIVPMSSSVLVSAIPLALWCKPEDVFLVNCGLQCLLSGVPVITLVLGASPLLFGVTSLPVSGGPRNTREKVVALGPTSHNSRDSILRLEYEFSG